MSRLGPRIGEENKDFGEVIIRKSCEHVPNIAVMK